MSIYIYIKYFIFNVLQFFYSIKEPFSTVPKSIAN